MRASQEVVDDAVAWAHLHGLVVGAGAGAEDAVVHAPISLFPAPFPRSEFLLVQQLMPLFADLVHTISLDREYLTSVLENAAQHDAFTARLLEIYSSSKAVHAPPITLALLRSDYMLDRTQGLLQVELNTIAASFACLSNQVSRLHSYLLSRHPAAAEVSLEQLPSNDAAAGFAEAMAAAVHAYATERGIAPEECVLVMVVQPGERNAFDQQWLSVRLWEGHKVRVVRKTLREIAEGPQPEDDGTLKVDGAAVAVLYLRAGYTPNDYPTEAEWTARERMESCNAVCSPNLAYQLVGTKKVQQDLATPGRLESFVKSPEDAEQLRKVFAGLYSLDDLSDADTQARVKHAIDHSADYVLKPQREGGGNNLYGEELVAKLQAKDDLASYILMQRIWPQVRGAQFLRNRAHTSEQSVSELGIYGAYVRVGDSVTVNKCIGHLLRTKAESSNEGGVAAGFAVLDSPYLVDDS